MLVIEEESRMDDWIDRLAEAMSTTPLSGQETRELLLAARDVAHRVERKITPLSTFFVGLAVGSKTAAGTDRPTALADALSTLREILPEAPGEPG
jgi:hypothetical protein